MQTYYNSTSKVLNPAQAGLTSTTTTYDDLGRREYVYNEEGIATRYVYDASSRMKETWLGVVPLAGIAGVRYQYEYDDFGNVTRIVDPLGHDRLKRYDSKGRLWREYTARGDGTTDLGTKRQVVEYGYYAGGQLKEKKQGVAVSVNGTHTFTRSTIYEYDPATGQMVKETASQGGLVQLVTTRSYNAKGNLEREEVRNGTNAIVHWKSYAYDPKTGKESQVSSPEGSISYTYHKDGSLASISTGSGQSNSYTYDAMGRIVRLQSTVLEPQNQPKAVTYEYSSALGLQKRVNYPNGTWEEKKYDERGRLSDLSLQLPDGYVDYIYGRDKRGLITSVYFNSWTSTIPIDEKVIVYGYDRLGRLTSTSTINYTSEPEQLLISYDSSRS